MVAAETLHSAELRLARYYARKLQSIYDQYQNGGAALTHALNSFDKETVQIRNWRDYAIQYAPLDADYDRLVMDFAHYMITPRYSLSERTQWQQLGLESARRLGDQAEEARFLEMLGYLALERGDLDAGRSYAQQSLQAAQAAEDDTLIMWALTRLGNAAAWSGNLDEAEALCQQALASRAIYPKSKVIIYNTLSIIFYMRGNLARAIQIAQESVELIQQYGDLQHLAVALQTLAVFSSAEGDVERADQYLSESLRLKYLLNDRATIPYGLLTRCMIAIELGQLNAAYHYSAEQEAIAREVDATRLLVEAWGQYGIIETLRGDYDEADEHFQRALTTAQELGNANAEQTVILRRLLLLLATGDYPTAKADCHAWLADTNTAKDVNDSWIPHWGLGKAALGEGAFAQAVEHFQAARPLAGDGAVNLIDIDLGLAEAQFLMRDDSGFEESVERANAVEQQRPGRIFYGIAALRAVQTKAALARGQRETARQTLGDALQRAQDLEFLEPRLRAIEAAAEFFAAENDLRCIRLFSLIAQHPGTPDLMRRDAEKRLADLATSSEAKFVSEERETDAEVNLHEMIRILSDELKP